MSRLVVIGDALRDRDLDGRAGRLAPDAPVPEAETVTLAERRGRAVVVPSVAGRSTTKLIEVARAG